jgi:hypothetical protein
MCAWLQADEMIAKVFKVEAISLRILDTVDKSDNDDDSTPLAAAKARAVALKTGGTTKASSKVAAEKLPEEQSAGVGAEKPLVKRSGWRLHEKHLNSSGAWYLRAAVWALYCVVIYW